MPHPSDRAPKTYATYHHNASTCPTRPTCGICLSPPYHPHNDSDLYIRCCQPECRYFETVQRVTEAGLEEKLARLVKEIEHLEKHGRWGLHNVMRIAGGNGEGEGMAPLGRCPRLMCRHGYCGRCKMVKVVEMGKEGRRKMDEWGDWVDG